MKILKKLTAAVLMATFMMTMGLTAFAAGGTKYNVGVTLYKDANQSSVSKGNEGIESVTAVTNADGRTMDVTINTRDITVFGFTGTLTELRLFDTTGNKYEGILSPDGYSFTVRNFPKSLIRPTNVIRGEFKTDFAIMGTRTGYLRIDTVSRAR